MNQRRADYYLHYSIKQFSEGLFGIEHRRYGRQAWCLAKTRKQHKCVITGVIINKGDYAYRPITNAGNRYERIAKSFFETNR